MLDHLRDPAFKSKLDSIRANPSTLMQHMQDQRVMQALSILLGVQMSTSPGNPCPDASCSDTSCAKTNPNAEPFASTVGQNTAQGTHAFTKDGDLSGSDTQKALAEKDLGNAAYKQKKFDEAIMHYDAAIALNPKNISLYTNKAAVFFETARFEECIKACTLAVEKGREEYADFKLIARALGRIGAAKEKLGDLEGAIQAYEKSLMEHRTSEILERLREAEKAVEQRKRDAYRDPQIAEAEREKGNTLFKDGDYAGAIKHYSEAIRRNDADPRIFSNRAACYTKLAAVPEGLKDCERAIALDASFVKAYIRKAALLMLKRDHAKALEVLGTARSMDKDGAHAAEINAQFTRCYQQQMGGPAAADSQDDANLDDETRVRRAIERDPEVGRILADPAMMQMLRQMQENPQAGASFMQNPDFASKLRKLVAAGVVRTG
jgi:stress-induced-phosphoprotein 1